MGKQGKKVKFPNKPFVSLPIIEDLLYHIL